MKGIQGLTSLNTKQLHHLATLVASPVSGNKPERISGIESAVAHTAQQHLLSLANQEQSSLPALESRSGRPFRPSQPQPVRQLSLLSIDMGIRNMAYSHLTAPLHSPSTSHSYPSFGTPTLQAWQRLSLSSSTLSSTSTTTSPSSSPPSQAESFEPPTLALHAYTFLHTLLTTHSPTHILIERQRFRSGGGSAVQEWTLRVGVLEGMLYAIHHALTRQGLDCGAMEPVFPKRVNRYWLATDEEFRERVEGVAKALARRRPPRRDNASQESTSGVLSEGEEEEEARTATRTATSSGQSKHVKTEKTRLLRRLCLASEHGERDDVTEPGQRNEGIEQSTGRFWINEGVRPTVAEFLANTTDGGGGTSEMSGPTPIDDKRIKRRTKSAGGAAAARSKVDDLSDCLLQGLVWIDWQNNRAKLAAEGVGGFELG